MDIQTLTRIAHFLAEQMNNSRSKKRGEATAAAGRWMQAQTLLAVAMDVDERLMHESLAEVNDWTNKAHVQAGEVLSALVLLQAGLYEPQPDEDDEEA